MLASLDSFKQSFHYNTMFDGFKKQLFGANKRGCMLTHLELSVCYLVCTKKYLPDVVLDMFWIDKAQLMEVVQSFERKMAEYSYRLPDSYKEMQPILQAYCKHDG
ncbi:MAG: hypothetical protein LBG19_12550 [Prevotellaceae bacterium]|jgi:hypothetical protein|nr:hypothetical protein [Prevotellaceae bacterium]